MPLGWAPSIAARIIDAARGGAAFQITAHHIQMHDRDPGPQGVNGTLNVGKRVAATFGPPTANEVATTGALSFTDWQSGGIVPTHFSSWSTATGGTFQGSGLVTITTPPAQGATLTIAAGALKLREAQASA